MGKIERLVLLGIETREVLADDFFRAITLDACGTAVPAHDLAARVEQVDGVVGEALDEQFKTPLTVLQALEGGLQFASALANFLLEGFLGLPQRTLGEVPGG